jgi:hypothetical protein
MFVIALRGRRMHLLGATKYPTGMGMARRARNLLMRLNGQVDQDQVSDP